jgi:hypothetical protein
MPAVTELISLDPSSEISGRTELHLNTGAIVVAAQGPDWGNAELQQYRAQAERGESVVDVRYPPRVVTLPLVIKEVAGTTFATARANLHNKVALIQREGGVLKRQLSNGAIYYADIIGATLTQGDQWMASQKQAEPGVVLTLDCVPDFYGPEVTLTDRTETTLPALRFVETDIGGDYPARCRFQVDEDQAGATQRSLYWAFRSRNYSSATAAAVSIDTNDLTPLDAATKTSGRIQHLALGSDWTPVVSGVRSTGPTYPTHVGSYRVFARCRSSDGSAVQARLVWGTGDLVAPVENSPAQLFATPLTTDFAILDLGEVHIDTPPIGTHRWDYQIQAKGDVGAEDIYVDWVWFFCIDESAGIVSRSSAAASYTNTVSDSFNQTAGNLSVKAADSGQNWDGFGDADDWTIDTANDFAQRTAVSDADTATGRFVLLDSPTAAINVSARATFSFTNGTSGGSRLGVVVRWTDISNYLLVYLNPDNRSLWLEKRVAGVTTQVASKTGVLKGSGSLPEVDFGHRIYVEVDADGNYGCSYSYTGLGKTAQFSGNDSVLATGGALASGKVGMYDANSTATANTRKADAFIADHGGQAADAVMYAGQSCILSTEGAFREDIGGVAWSRCGKVLGNLPRLPTTTDGRSVEVLMKASRSALDEEIPDSATDDISAQGFYRPSYMFVPE